MSASAIGAPSHRSARARVLSPMCPGRPNFLGASLAAARADVENSKKDQREPSMKPRHLAAAMLLAIGTNASAGSDLQRAVQTAPFPGLAYAQVPATSGFEYGRIL